jgi:hypothetical protein
MLEKVQDRFSMVFEVFSWGLGFRVLGLGFRFHVYFLDSPEILASESLHYINQLGSKKLL